MAVIIHYTADKMWLALCVVSLHIYVAILKLFGKSLLATYVPHAANSYYT